MIIKQEISVILFAGGSSKRMGSDKRILEVDGSSLADRALGLAQQLSDDIVISANDTIPAFEGFHVVPDIVPGSGPVAGLISALPHIQTPSAIALSVDMPFLTKDLVQLLIAKHRPNEITYFIYNGQMQPFPAIYPAGYADEMAHAFANNITSMKGLLTMFPSKPVPVMEQYSKQLLNINSRDDLEKAKRSGAGKG